MYEDDEELEAWELPEEYRHADADHGIEPEPQS